MKKTEVLIKIIIEHTDDPSLTEALDVLGINDKTSMNGITMVDGGEFILNVTDFQIQEIK